MARLAQEPDSRVRNPIRLYTFFSLSADSRGTVVSYWRKYVHEILVNRPDMTIGVYRGRKTITTSAKGRNQEIIRSNMR